MSGSPDVQHLSLVLIVRTNTHRVNGKAKAEVGSGACEWNYFTNDTKVAAGSTYIG